MRSLPHLAVELLQECRSRRWRLNCALIPALPALWDQAVKQWFTILLF